MRPSSSYSSHGVRRQTEGGQPSAEPGTIPERLYLEDEELDPTRQRELDDQVDKHRDDEKVSRI